ncbi:ectoine synthase [Moorena sp. SIO3A2]|uniref:ectoine synthase n=1 Tax=Moorena sp. SIO3A2 TaxID=2607841 RepID=UPI0013BB909B|nr:ectoine synthase [Moorena sp. SIO3A2]NER85509.1 hypothetical protein [Moorena sp. SIO3A2]
MILRRLQEIIGTEHEVFAENKNWVSRQLLLKEDQMGFSLHDTIIFAKTETPIWSKNHVEALYCVEGEGEIEVIESGNIYKLTPGTLYALNLHEEHYLRASKDMRIICVFNPPLSSPEVHLPNGSYQADPDARQFIVNRKKDPMTFAYLNLKGHPRGNYMLDRLIQAGLEPALVIEECSDLATAGRQELEKQLQKIAAETPLPRSLPEILAGRNVRCVETANHNDAQSEELLTALCPDLIVLGDTRIIRNKNILRIPELGIVNVHPGYLPTVRGNNPYLWSIVHDLPQGVTVHFIDEGVDSGPIIARQRLYLQPRATYPQLLAAINRLCGELLLEALCFLKAGGVQSLAQGNFENPGKKVFRLCPPEIKSAAIQKLESGEYRFEEV